MRNKDIDINGRRLREDFIIFLDIDGVLNSWDKDTLLKKRPDINKKHIGYMSERKVNLVNELHLDNIINFNKLIDYLSKFYEVDIVIISSWRQRLTIKEFIRIFKLAGIKGNIISMIKRYPMKPMGEGFDYSLYERDFLVYKWVEENNVRNYIILDDEKFNYEKYGLDKKLYRTDLLKGLTRNDVENITKLIKT